MEWNSETIAAIPGVLVALVATAVSYTALDLCLSLMLLKIHATLKDLQSAGPKKKKRQHFSATAYYSIYDDHMDTMGHMQKKRPGSLTKMLKDLYDISMYVRLAYSCLYFTNSWCRDGVPLRDDDDDDDSPLQYMNVDTMEVL